MLDPHTAAELTLEQIRALCDNMIRAHGMKEFCLVFPALVACCRLRYNRKCRVGQGGGCCQFLIAGNARFTGGERCPKSGPKSATFRWWTFFRI
jgi:hypothetical protein